jgi:hypothetical protein
MYKLIVDPSHNLLEGRLSGSLDTAEASEFASDLARCLSKGKLQPGHLLLIDVTECGIQPQATLNAIHARPGNVPKASRIAVVTGSSVVRMQARRVMTQPYARLFEDRASALAWLVGRQGDGGRAAPVAAVPAMSAG